MGSADVIPGVSGGTIALITGIYEDLIAALRSLDIRMVRKILVLDIKGAVADAHIRFLLTLFSGIIVAILSLAQLMNYLLHYHPVPIWSLFFGLIVASILVVGKQVTNWLGKAGICFVAGTLAAVCHCQSDTDQNARRALVYFPLRNCGHLCHDIAGNQRCFHFADFRKI